MKQKYSLAVLALLGMLSSAEAHKLDSRSKAVGRDWDDLVGDQSVFNARGYARDTPDGYGDVVDEVSGEEEAADESRRQKALEGARAQAAHQAKLHAEEDQRQKLKAQAEARHRAEVDARSREQE